MPVVVKAIAGGCLVVAFAMVTDVLKPKAFAGLFSAASSVAIASLAVTAALMSADKAAQSALAMVAGAVAGVLYASILWLPRRLSSRGKIAKPTTT